MGGITIPTGEGGRREFAGGGKLTARIDRAAPRLAPFVAADNVAADVAEFSINRAFQLQERDDLNFKNEQKLEMKRRLKDLETDITQRQGSSARGSSVDYNIGAEQIKKELFTNTRDHLREELEFDFEVERFAGESTVSKHENTQADKAETAVINGVAKENIDIAARNPNVAVSAIESFMDDMEEYKATGLKAPEIYDKAAQDTAENIGISAIESLINDAQTDADVDLITASIKSGDFSNLLGNAAVMTSDGKKVDFRDIISKENSDDLLKTGEAMKSELKRRKNQADRNVSDVRKEKRVVTEDDFLQKLRAGELTITEVMKTDPNIISPKEKLGWINKINKRTQIFDTEQRDPLKESDPAIFTEMLRKVTNKDTFRKVDVIDINALIGLDKGVSDNDATTLKRILTQNKTSFEGRFSRLDVALEQIEKTKNNDRFINALDPENLTIEESDLNTIIAADVMRSVETASNNGEDPVVRAEELIEAYSTKALKNFAVIPDSSITDSADFLNSLGENLTPEIFNKEVESIIAELNLSQEHKQTIDDLLSRKQADLAGLLPTEEERLQIQEGRQQASLRESELAEIAEGEFPPTEEEMGRNFLEIINLPEIEEEGPIK